MNFLERNWILEDFKSLDVNSILAQRVTYSYSNLEKIFLSIENSPPAKLFACICDMRLEAHDIDQPYKTRFIIDNRRGLVPSDLPTQVLQILKEFCGNLDNPLLRARLADLLWVTRVGKIEFAIVAIESFISSVELLIQLENIDENSHEIIKIVERAIRLSSRLRSNPKVNTMFISIIDLVQDQLLSIINNDHKRIKLTEILVEVAPKEIKHAYLIEILKEISKKSIKSKDFLIAERSYQCIIGFSYITEDKNLEEKINKKISKCYLRQAKEISNGFVSAHFVKCAIEYLSKVQNTRKKRVKLYELMRDFQREGMTQLQTFSIDSTDITEIKERAIKRVKGVDLFDELMRFSIYINLPENLEDIKGNIFLQNNGLFSSIFSSLHIDHEALPVAEVRVNDEEKIWESLIKSLKISHQISVEGIIIPALKKIVEEYHLSEEYFFDLLRNNSFIPDGHLGYFAKGIYSGFTGDFLTATHLLVPQIENSLRYILSCSGEEPTTLHSDGTQERDSLKSLLDNEVIQNVLTKNISENLKVLLLDKIYGDHRNQISHGYMPNSYFYSYSSIYLWWFIFHILMIANYKEWRVKYDPKILKIETSVPK